jgi:hypothetical protein
MFSLFSSALSTSDEQKVNKLTALVQASCKAQSVRGDLDAEDAKLVLALKAAIGIDPNVKKRADELNAAYLNSEAATMEDGDMGWEGATWLVAIAGSILSILGQDPFPQHHQNRISEDYRRRASAEEQGRQKILSNPRIDRESLLYTFMQSAGLKLMGIRTREQSQRAKRYGPAYGPSMCGLDGRCDLIWITELEKRAFDEYERTHR